MKHEYDLQKALSPYIPSLALADVLRLIGSKPVQITLSRKRDSKFGDYRPPQNGSKYHEISVNADLNPYAFLITFLHEWAHLQTFEEHRNRVQPHGQEWKTFFNKLIFHFIEIKCFPEDVAAALLNYARKTAASSSSDTHLMRVLDHYGSRSKEKAGIYVEQLPYDAVFTYQANRFQKKEKIRKNYRCICLDSNRIYRFHPLAVVVPAEGVDKTC